ncbi:GIY-YIG nuclease family protein [Patescibacteria group bacterium]|nr:GIY-YIG nuclease family protein [Patescibacteria group bacterium]
MHHVYILQNSASEYYIGYTNDIERRLREHANKKPGYTLLYYESYQSQAAARDREQKLKYYGSAWRGLKKRILGA